MPGKPPRICRCGKVVPAGDRCACTRERDRERKARHDANRPSASARGYGREWRAARAKFLALHPVCARCRAPATVVDHIVPHRGDPARFWDRSNWQSLCAPHHNASKQREEARARNRG